MQHSNNINMLIMAKTIAWYAVGLVSLLLLWNSESFGGTFVAWGPQSVVRVTGPSTTVTTKFPLPQSNATYMLRIDNGGAQGEFARVTGVDITLNGKMVVRRSEMTQAVPTLTKPVALLANNTLKIQVQGQRGSGITVEILGDTLPVADAGAALHASVAVPIRLDGSASYDPDGHEITFVWTLRETPLGSTARFTDPIQPKPQFTPDRPGTYVLQLVVDNGLKESLPDQTTLAAVTGDAPPNAHAGRDQHARVGVPVRLNGSGSSDPNQSTLSFLWSFATLPRGSALTNTAIAGRQSPIAMFTPDVQGLYEIKLQVHDGSRTDEDIVQLQAHLQDVPPNADAGPDVTVEKGQEVTLDGSGSNDPDDSPTPLSYVWTFVAVPPGSVLTNADIIAAMTAKPRWTPDIVGAYVLRVTVHDGAQSDADNVVVSAIDTTPPVLTLVTPASHSTVTSQPQQRFEGHLHEFATLTLNGQPVKLGPANTFSHGPVTLKEGLNTFALVAVDPTGNRSQLSVEVILDTGPPSAINAAQVSVSHLMNGQVQVSSAADSVEAGATVAVTNLRTGQTVTAPVSHAGSFTASMVGQEGDEFAIVIIDRVGNIGATQKIVWFLHGLGEEDGIAPHTVVIPGYAMVQLTSGNLHFSAVARTYHTAVMGPDIVVAYNHLDSLTTGLGRGWRTNYDMRLFDGAVDRNGDGRLDMQDRRPGDRLVLIDEAGRRFVFTYDSTLRKFRSAPQSGLIDATVNPDATTFGPGGYAYKLIRNDNHGHYFDQNGHLVRREDLRGKGLTITRAPTGEALKVVDDYGRQEDVTRLAFGGSPAPSLTVLAGRQLGDWQFTYDGQGRLQSIRLSGKAPSNFTHGTNVVEYGVSYDPISQKVTMITLPQVGGMTLQKVITYAGTTRVEVAEPFGGQTTYDTDPQADAWSRLTNAGNVTTTRILDVASRRITKVTTGRYGVTMAYDRLGNLASQAVNGGQTSTYTYTDLGGLEGANLLASTTLQGAGGSTVYTYYTDARQGLVHTVTAPCNSTPTIYAYEPTSDSFLTQTTDTRGKTWQVTRRDNVGQPLEIRTPAGRTMQMAYTPTGRAASETDILGYTTQYGYDSRERLIQMNPPGWVQGEQPTTTTYDPFSRVTETRDVNNWGIAYTYDALGRPTRVSQNGVNPLEISYTRLFPGLQVITRRGARILSIIDQDGLGRITRTTVKRVLQEGRPSSNTSTQLTYTSGEGWLEKTTNARGYATTYTYDDAGRVLQTMSPEGASSTTRYAPGTGWVSATTDPDGHTTQMAYDACGRVTQHTNPAGGTVVIAHDPLGNVLSVTPSAGNGKSFEYDDDGLLKQRIDILGKSHAVTIDIAARILKRTTDNNSARIVEQMLDSRGFVAGLRTPLGTTTFTRRKDGVITQVVAPDRGPVAIERDSLNRLTAIRTPAGGQRYQYDAVTGDLTVEYNALGLRTTYNYHPETGELLLVQDDVASLPLQPRQDIWRVVQRDATGNIVQFKDKAGRAWMQAFDKDNRRIQQTAPDGVVTQWEYTKGRVVQAITVAGAKTTFASNALGLRTRTVDPTQRETTATYDEFGLLMATTHSSFLTAYEYDPDTRLLTKVIAPGDRVTTFERDTFGRVGALIDPKSLRTDYVYNAFDRITQITYPRDHTGQRRTESFTYYASGDVKEFTDRAGRKSLSTYDPTGRLVGQQFLDTGEQIALAYNAANQVTEAMFIKGLSRDTVRRSYDKRGRLLSLVQDATTVSFGYTNDDRLAYKHGLVYTYDSRTGQLQSVSNDGGSVRYFYDTAGRKQREEFSPGVSRSFGYDLAGRLISMAQRLGGEEEHYTYDYDPEGRLQTMAVQSPISGDATVGFLYDTSGRLAREQRTGVGAYDKRYLYDANDNRTHMQVNGQNRLYAYSDLNQLVSITGAENAIFDYDAAGRQTSRTQNGVRTTYSYDRLDRLTDVAASGQVSRYNYYGPTWVRRMVSVQGGGLDALTTCIYDGFACIAQTNNFTGETVHYAVPGSTPLWVFMYTTSTPLTYAYSQDGRGNVTGLWNYTTSGSRFQYDAFGNVTQMGNGLSGSTAKQASAQTLSPGIVIPPVQTDIDDVETTSAPRYQGQLYDKVTDLIYLRHRYYMPGIGRFITPDPIGYAGGLNLSGYAGGDPVNRCDPWGLDWRWTGPNEEDSKPHWEEIPGSPKIAHPGCDGTRIGETWPVTIYLGAIKHVEKPDIVDEAVTKEADKWGLYGIVSRSRQEALAGLEKIINAYLETKRIRERKDFMIRELVRDGHSSAGIGGGEILQEEDIQRYSPHFATEATIKDHGCYGGLRCYEHQAATLWLLTTNGGWVEGWTDKTSGVGAGVKGKGKYLRLPVAKDTHLNEMQFLPKDLIQDALHYLTDAQYEAMIAKFSQGVTDGQRQAVVKRYESIIEQHPTYQQNMQDMQESYERWMNSPEMSEQLRRWQLPERRPPGIEDE